MVVMRAGFLLVDQHLKTGIKSGKVMRNSLSDTDRLNLNTRFEAMARLAEFLPQATLMIEIVSSVLDT